MSERGGVEAFTVAALELLGGVAEPQAPGLYSVLWPDPGAGEPAVRQLAFDPELMDEAPDAELVSFASPALEHLLQQATASGRVARAYLHAGANASRSTAERLARAYRFLESAWTPQHGRPWWVPAGVFLFRVRYLSDAREEDLVEVAVTLTDGRLLRRLGEVLDRHALVAEPLEAWPMMAERPAGEAYAGARHELEQRLLAPLGRRRRELESRLGRESGRAQAYYAELIREREEPRAALPPDSPERVQVDSKLLAIRREREGRLAELRAKYRLSADVSLLSVLRLYLPRVVFTGTLAGTRGRAELTLYWDPIAQTGEPARCSRCDGLTYEVGLHRGGGAACPRCLDGGDRSPRRP
ncbi:MAG: hypothetical protein AAB226_07365 [candidate division NC10 bacterium]